MNEYCFLQGTEEALFLIEVATRIQVYVKLEDFTLIYWVPTCYEMKRAFNVRVVQ